MRSIKIIKICSSSLCTCLHHMVILRTRNKITNFLMILAWASPFNNFKIETSENKLNGVYNSWEFYHKVHTIPSKNETYSCSLPLQLNPLSPHDALKHHFTSLKTDLIFLQLGFSEWKFPWNWLPKQSWQFSLIFKPHQIIFILYKSGIAIAIRGL